MKGIYFLSTIILLFIFTSRQAESQRPLDNDFQNYIARVNSVLQKPAANLSQRDVNILMDAISKDDKFFGPDYQNTFRGLKQDAKKKYEEYTELKSKTEEQKKIDEEKNLKMMETQTKLQQTEAQRDSVIDINQMLQTEIQKLKSRITKLTGERNSLQKANKKLLEENKITAATLQDVRTSIKRILNLKLQLGGQSEMGMQLPTTLRDSLNNVECGVSEMLRSNYQLTLKTMENDKNYMDSVVKYFREHNQYPFDLNDYLSSGLRLADSMKTSSLDCVKLNGENITLSIENFQKVIDEQVGNKPFSKTTIIIFIALFAAVLIAAIIVMTRRKSKRQL